MRRVCECVLVRCSQCMLILPFCGLSRVYFHIWSNQMDHSSKSNMTYVSLFLPIHLPFILFLLRLVEFLGLNWCECGRKPEKNDQMRTYVDSFDIFVAHKKEMIHMNKCITFTSLQSKSLSTTIKNNHKSKNWNFS